MVAARVLTKHLEAQIKPQSMLHKLDLVLKSLGDKGRRIKVQGHLQLRGEVSLESMDPD